MKDEDEMQIETNQNLGTKKMKCRCTRVCMCLIARSEVNTTPEVVAHLTVASHLCLDHYLCPHHACDSLLYLVLVSVSRVYLLLFLLSILSLLCLQCVSLLFNFLYSGILVHRIPRFALLVVCAEHLRVESIDRRKYVLAI